MANTTTCKTDGSKRPMLRWTEDMDEKLIDALIRQQVLGNRVDGVFTTTAYNNIVKEVRENTNNPSIDKQKVQNRMKSLKENFNASFQVFKKLNGFAWSPVTKLFDAEDDLWEKLIEANPDARKWKTTKLLNYDKLLSIFGKYKATSDAGETVRKKKARRATSKDDIVKLASENKDSQEFITNLESPNTEPSQVPISPKENESSHSRMSTSSKGKRKVSFDVDFGIDYEDVKSAIKHVGDAIMMGNTIAERRNDIIEKTRPRVYSEKEIFDELNNIAVDDHLLYRAYDFLTGDPQKGRSFFGVPAGERKAYLLHMMFGSHDLVSS